MLFHSADQLLLQQVAYKIKHQLPLEGWKDLPYTFPGAADLNQVTPLESTYLAFSCLQELSGLKTVKFDCCCNSCICYAGLYAEKEGCYHCGEPHYVNSRPFDDTLAARS